MYTVAALYRFTPTDAPRLQAVCKARFAALNICGTLLVAPEGINGTLAGSQDSIDAMLDFLAAETGLERADVKFSSAPERPFDRLKIRLKREIITFNQPTAAPDNGGQYVSAQDWNALIADPDTLLLDTRNTYETAVGTFAGAIDPGISSFTQFADFVRSELSASKHRKVAMYCTGGIRCEKASAFMKAEGFAEVYHLKGGILKYLEDIPAQESRWRGECYVFDKRVTVGHGLAAGSYGMCERCGTPIARTDVQNAQAEPCAICANRDKQTAKAE